MANSNHSYTIPLKGVESEHCALIVDNVLASIEGLLSHRVELNNRQAVIESLSPQKDITQAIQSIRDLGYDIERVKTQIPVLMMSCASCAVSVESTLKSIVGVIKAEVNFANAMVQVEYVPGLTDLKKMRAAVQSIGYDLKIDGDAKESESLASLRAASYNKLQFKTFAALLLSTPVFLIGMFFMDIPYANQWMWLFSTPVLFWFGKDFFINAYKQAKHKTANMDTLVAMSTGIAYLFSVFNMLYPQFWLERGLQSHVYFEAASVVIAFILLGKLLEEKAKGNTSAAIEKLIGLQPQTAHVLSAQGETIETQLSDVEKNASIQVKPGEKIPFDGTVLSGDSYIDESSISGEPIPVHKEKGQTVFAGSLNQKGSFIFRADKVGNETLLAKIIQVVQEAQGSKAPVQKQVDKIASVFVPVVIGIAALSFFIWWIFGGPLGFTHGLMAFVTVLVIACPCALGLATPTAIMVGVGKAAENGILIRDAESLEKAGHVDAIVVDKTGTLTIGKPDLSHIEWLNNDASKAGVLFNIEKQSEHPLAMAITNAIDAKENIALESFESITGFGAKASFLGETYYVGKLALLTNQNIKVDAELNTYAETWLAEAQTVTWFADSKQALAVIAISDPLKEGSQAAIQSLKDLNIEVYMMTGDNEKTAAVIAQKTGIVHYHADVLPQGKSDFIKALQAKGKIVAMVGDGINDSTALAMADLSIAMGHGSDIAMDVARMTIISSDLRKIPRSIQLSKQTTRTINQNLFWAFIYNLIGIPIAAGILYSFNGFLLNPMIAGAAMALSSVSVVSNSLLLRFRK